MKKVSLIFAIVFIATAASAQTKNQRIFKPFKVDVSSGFALRGGSNAGTAGGLLFAAEPKYAVAEQFAIGLRFELATMSNPIIFSPGWDGELEARISSVATGDYYFNNNFTRPFIGAGAGVYHVGSPNYSSENKFGFMFRAGIEAGHLRLGIEYNAVGKSQYSEHNSYIGFKLGACIGGGRYKK